LRRWWQRHIADVIIALILGPIVALILYGGWHVYRVNLIASQCLECGWPGAKMLLNGDGYCSIRVEQTDYVMPVGFVAANCKLDHTSEDFGKFMDWVQDNVGGIK
jgi:hypothetical protein